MNFSEQKLYNVLCFILFLNIAPTLINAQINVTHVNNGIYNYSSNLPDAHLHFYMYDDGYHSFEKNNTHDFSSTFNGNPVAFTTDPYSNDDPEEGLVGGGEQGSNNPTIDVVEMDYKIQIKRSWNLVEDKNNYFILMFENDKSNSPISGCVEFHYNDVDNTIDYNNDVLDQYNNWVSFEGEEPSDYTNQGYTDKFVWSFNDLELNEQRFIYIRASCNQPSFSIIKNCAVMKKNCSHPAPPIPPPPYEGEEDNNYDSNDNNGYGQDDVYVLSSKVSNFPHDPNCIVPSCVPNNFEIDPLNPSILTVKYRIYFQNDGIDPVQNVTIESGFDSDILSVKLHDSSDYCSIFWGQNEIKTYFPDIFLPGSQGLPPEAYDMTVGWVDLIVCFTHEVSTEFFNDNHCIYHMAAIDFDGFPPIRVEDTYCSNNWEYCWKSNYDQFAKQDYEEVNCSNNSSYQESPHMYLKETERRNQTAQLTNDLQLFPNPTHNKISVKSIGFTQGQNSYDSINIFDINGQRLKVPMTHININLIEFDVSELLDGIYLISNKNELGTQTKTFVKH